MVLASNPSPEFNGSLFEDSGAMARGMIYHRREVTRLWRRADTPGHRTNTIFSFHIAAK
jgi:hypothetical protein